MVTSLKRQQRVLFIALFFQLDARPLSTLRWAHIAQNSGAEEKRVEKQSIDLCASCMLSKRSTI